MEAIGTLAGGVSHDFNNLLQVISGFTHLLIMDKDEEDPDYTKLQSIDGAVQRASDLVRQLLYFSRRMETDRKYLDLNNEVKRAQWILERTLPKMISVTMNLGEGLWPVKADPIQMEQVMLNLGVNAADAMPGGGELVLVTGNMTIGAGASTSTQGIEPGRYVLLRVSDTGHGMDQETLEHIFEPFFTTKAVGKGTGLGLASVFGIVKGHGGYISCTSEVGQGTSFSIYLPAAESMSGAASFGPDSSGPPGGIETILVVDDEKFIRDTSSEILQRYGYNVLTAASGEQALEIYASRSGEIDLVLMDIGMPGMGGHKCLSGLLGINPQAKVIINSGYPVDGAVKQSLESGAAGYVGKPYHVNDLLNHGPGRPGQGTTGLTAFS